MPLILYYAQSINRIVPFSFDLYKNQFNGDKNEIEKLITNENSAASQFTKKNLSINWIDKQYVNAVHTFNLIMHFLVTLNYFQNISFSPFDQPQYIFILVAARQCLFSAQVLHDHIILLKLPIKRVICFKNIYDHFPTTKYHITTCLNRTKLHYKRFIAFATDIYWYAQLHTCVCMQHRHVDKQKQCA